MEGVGEGGFGGEGLEDVPSLFSGGRRRSGARRSLERRRRFGKRRRFSFFTFIMRSACSARLLVKGTSKSTRKRRTSSLNCAAGAAGSLRAFAWSRPVAVWEGGAVCGGTRVLRARCPRSGCRSAREGRLERVFAPRPRVADRPVGVAEQIAHGLGPRFMIEFDQRLEFAQMMGVAERMVGSLSSPP